MQRDPCAGAEDGAGSLLHGVGELAKHLGDGLAISRPGLDLIVYGLVLVLVLVVLPRGLVGLVSTLWRRVTKHA